MTNLEPENSQGEVSELTKDWRKHWLNRPDDYTLEEWLDKFWDERGGRELYFPTEEEN